METKYFKINRKEYCHITNDVIFIINSKVVSRVPLEFELGEGWGIISMFNYIIFAFLFAYIAFCSSYYGIKFLKEPINYGALFLLFMFFIRIKNSFMTSRTPTISRNKIKSVYFKTPRFSYPRLVIYFAGQEGKVLRKIIPVMYKREAMPVLKETGVLV